MNPKRDKKADSGIENTKTCNIKKPIPVAKDNRIDIINLSVFFKKTALTIPKKIVIPKKIPLRIK